MGTSSSKSSEPLNQSLTIEADPAGNLDPRSPTPEIIRTPLQTKTGVKHNITKNLDLRKAFENGSDELIHNNPILSAVIKNHLQSVDPRSPTQDFERTPINIVTKSTDSKDNEQISNKEDDENKKELVGKNLCNGFLDMTLTESIQENEEPLGSSTASNEAIELDISNDPKVNTGFLETNFDYLINDVEQNDNTDVCPQAVEEKKFNELAKLTKFEILEDDPRSPSIGIDRTPIVVTKLEDMSDDALIKALQSKNAELRYNATKSQDTTSDGLLIFEDQVHNLNETPKKSKSAGSNGSRTPLSCMKNKSETPHMRSKSANMLYDGKNLPTKIPKRVSQIPRLTSLTKPNKLAPIGSSISLKNIVKAVSGDSENTPPHSHRDKWGKDNSIIL